MTLQFVRMILNSSNLSLARIMNHGYLLLSNAVQKFSLIYHFQRNTLAHFRRYFTGILARNTITETKVDKFWYTDVR